MDEGTVPTDDTTVVVEVDGSILEVTEGDSGEVVETIAADDATVVVEVVGNV